MLSAGNGGYMPTEAHKTIAKHVAGVWQRRPRIIEMRADGTSHVQAFAELVDFPIDGVVAYATVGLSDCGGFEVATLGPTKYKSVSKALFDVASYVAAGDRRLKNDEAFEKILGRYYSRSNACHWLVRAEAPQGFEISDVELPGRRVRWMYAWPVTSDELVWYQGGHGQELGTLLSSAGLYAFDLGRSSLKGVPEYDPWKK